MKDKNDPMSGAKYWPTERKTGHDDFYIPGNRLHAAMNQYRCKVREVSTVVNIFKEWDNNGQNSLKSGQSTKGLV